MESEDAFGKHDEKILEEIQNDENKTNKLCMGKTSPNSRGKPVIIRNSSHRTVTMTNKLGQEEQRIKRDELWTTICRVRVKEIIIADSHLSLLPSSCSCSH